MAQVISGCAVRAAIQQEQEHPLADDDRHYLAAIKARLTALYDLADDPRTREQISDEMDWVNGKLGEQD